MMITCYSAFKKTIAAGLILFASVNSSFSQQQYATWLKQSGGTNEDYISDVVVATDGSIYTLGTFTGSAVFGSHILQTTANTVEVFVSKSDANGNVLWVRGFGESAGKLALGPQGSIYVSGIFSGTEDFGNFSLTSVAWGQDIFLLKMESNGDVTWAQKFTGAANNSGYVTSQIVSDASGNIYMGGSYIYNLTFGSTTLSLPSGNEMYLAKINSSGTPVWARNYGGSTNQLLTALDVDASGNIYSSGVFPNSITIGTSTFASYGNYDIVLFKTDPLGEVLWAKQFGGSNYNAIAAIATDDQGNSYVTGYSIGVTQFGTYFFSAASSNVFLCKINTAGTPLWMKNYSHVDGSYGSSDIVIDNAGNSYITGSFERGIDFDSQHALTTLDPQGNFLTGRKGFALKNDPAGNVIWSRGLGGIYDPEDSFNPSAFGTAIAFDGGGNALVGGYFVGNMIEPNVILTTVFGGTWVDNYDCFLTKLTNCSVNPGVTQNGNTLTATASGASYQWIHCNSPGSVIAGATSQSFTPTSVGNYAVRVTANNCTVTSNCVAITTLGLEDLAKNGFTLYPNPSNGTFKIVTEAQSTITITNAAGQLIETYQLESGENTLELNQVESGVYFISAINSNGQISVQRISIIK